MVASVYGPNNRAGFSFLKAADSMDRGNFPRELWVRRDLWTPDNARHVEALLGHLQYLGWLPPPGGLPPS